MSDSNLKIPLRNQNIGTISNSFNKAINLKFNNDKRDN